MVHLYQPLSDIDTRVLTVVYVFRQVAEISSDLPVVSLNLFTELVKLTHLSLKKHLNKLCKHSF